MWKKVPFVIIGSGPAGCSAAVYLGNSGIEKGILLTGSQPGGLLTTTDYVVNYPGFKNIGGFELTEKFMEHASEYVTIKYETVEKIEKKGEEKYLFTSEKGGYITKYIIIATGSAHKKLGVPGENELANLGVSYCAVCDGMLFQNKIVGVIGGGDAAVEEAVYLSNIAKKVHIFLRRNTFRAKAINVKNLMKNNINIHYFHEVKEVLGTEKLTSVNFTTPNGKKNFKIDGLFIAIGQYPNTKFLGELVKLKNGYIQVQENFETSLKGVYACGDVIYRKHHIKQAVTSAAEGCIAALNLSNKISKD